MKKYFYIIVCLVLAMFKGSAQNKIDSLEHFVKTATTDTAKVNALDKLFLEYEFNDVVKAGDCLDKALELAKKINYEKGLACTYIYKGYLVEDKGNYPEALNYYKIALTEATEAESKKDIGSAYNNIGAVYYYQGNYPEALKNYFLSLKVDEEMGSKVGIAYSYNNVGLVYEMQGNYEQALLNYKRSLKIKEELKDKMGISASYNNIGDLYNYQFKFEEALKNYFISLKIRKEINDKAGLGDSYNNIGVIYYEQGKREMNTPFGKNNIDQAVKNFTESLKIREEMGDKGGIASSLINLGAIYTKQKKFDDAKKCLARGKKLSEEIGSKVYLKDVYSALTELDSTMNDFKGAYRDSKLCILYRDSLDNEETRKKTIQSQMTYDFDKKEAVAMAEHKKELENQSALAGEKSRKQKIILFFVLGSLFLVLLLAGFIFRSLRITRKQKNLIELQKNLVMKQKLEVEEQKKLVEEKQKEILDSIHYAKRIQMSLLPTEKYMERNLNRIKKD